MSSLDYGLHLIQDKDYFVETKIVGDTFRWEYLNGSQANAIYAEQVEKYGLSHTTTGAM